MRHSILPVVVATVAALLCQAVHAEFVRTIAYAQNTVRTALVAIDSGSTHTCARIEDGTTRCWGDNASGQLGDGSTSSRTSPVRVTALTNVISLGAGADHTCALTGDQRVACWGGNAFGQLGDGTTTRRLTFVQPQLTNVSAIAAGLFHTCAIVGGGVRCWGANDLGQLGDGTNSRRLTPTVVPGISNARALVAGNFHTCVVRADGTAACWGANAEGQIGDGTLTNRNVPTSVTGLGLINALAAGWGHTCAQRSTGEVRCWGNNDNGQLGDGTTTRRLRPFPVANLGGLASAIDANLLHTCALLANGTIRCWGLGEHGQLGNGSNVSSTQPVTVAGLPITGFNGVSLGELHSCGLTAMGTVHCWGNDDLGQLGNGTAASTNRPDVVAGIQGRNRGWTVSGSNIVSCAVRASGRVACWGMNTDGQLGSGGTDQQLHTSPEDLSSLANIVTLQVGGAHTCALIVTGRVRCWGVSNFGQTGTVAPSVPTPSLIAVDNVVGLAVGDSFSCALQASGTVQCWGQNDDGQLGVGPGPDRASPALVQGVTRAIAIVAGPEAACAMIVDGTAQCWGAMFTQPDGRVFPGSPAVSVTSFGQILGIAPGHHHLCALGVNASVRCLGLNNEGQLGNGSQQDSAAPVTVFGMGGDQIGNSALAVDSGSIETCAIAPFGTVRCWGNNGSGRLGDGSGLPRQLTPVTAQSLAAVVSVDPGTTSCALRSDGLPFCWGMNSVGTVGNGVVFSGGFFADEVTPVEVVSFR